LPLAFKNNPARKSPSSIRKSDPVLGAPVLDLQEPI
jgi:hypothetical protein